MTTVCPKCNSKRIVQHADSSWTEKLSNGAGRGKDVATVIPISNPYIKVLLAIGGFIYGMAEATPDNHECKSCKHTWYKAP